MNRHIESNKQDIQENKQRIQANKSEIEKIKDEARWTSEAHQTRLERIIHRLITALIVAIALLVISNLLWIVAWSKGESLNIFNKDGTSNYIGGDGNIGG